jgi:putative membrane protein
LSGQIRLPGSGNPANAACAWLYLGGWLTYYFDLVRHILLEIVFLSVGILVTAPLVSSDPLPRRTSYVSRLFDIIIEMQVHAIFGLVMLLSATPLVAYFVTAAPEAWNVDPVRDQAANFARMESSDRHASSLSHGGIAKTNAKAQSRNDAEMVKYNEYLRRLQQRDSDTTANPRT